MKKLYSLTPPQMLHQNWIEQYGRQQVAGLSAMAVLKMKIDFEILSLAINEELKRQKCLCFRFTKDEKTKEVKQYFVKHEEEKFNVIDLSKLTYEKAVEFLQMKAYDELMVYDSKCYEINLLIMPDDYYGFFMHVDHRLMDGYAMSETLKDIFYLYCSFKYGTKYPDEVYDYEEMLKKDIARAQNCKRNQAAKSFWDGQLKELGEPVYSDIKGTEVLDEARKAHKNAGLNAADIEKDDLMVLVKNYRLGSDSSRELFDFCRRNNINITNLLLLGLRTYLSKVNGGQEDITVENFISRRTTKDQWTSGGCRTIMFPCRSKISDDCGFKQAAEIIKNIQTRVYYYNNYDPAKIFEEIKAQYKTPEDTSYESCYFTYQPKVTGLDNPILKDVDLRYKWFSNGAATKKMYLTVSPEADGSLNFSFHYQRACLNEHDIELLYYYMMKIIFKGVEDPNITIGQLLAV